MIFLRPYVYILLGKRYFNSMFFEECIDCQDQIALNIKSSAEMGDPEFQTQVDRTAVKLVGEYDGLRILQDPGIIVH